MSVSPAFLDSISRGLVQLPLDPGDAAIVAGMIAGQRDGLARLAELDLTAVEPAVAIHPDEEARR